MNNQVRRNLRILIMTIVGIGILAGWFIIKKGENFKEIIVMGWLLGALMIEKGRR